MPIDAADLVIVSRRVVLPGGIQPAAVHVRAGKICRVSLPDAVPSGVPVIDAGADAVLPGVVDCHVHMNEPGRTDWEGFETGTRAAAAGGVTTIVDMPLNSIPATTSVAALAEKAGAVANHAFVDYAFWGGVVPGNSHEIAPMLDAGARGFKCFLVDSGVPEFPAVTEGDLIEAMPVIARERAVLLVHAELPGPIEAAVARSGGRDPRRYSTFLAARPAAAEDEAVEMMIRLARATACRIHVVHLSSAGALRAIDAAKVDGVPVSAETCPHYLTFTAEDIPDGRTEFKCCPPIRDRANRERLWDGLRRGVIEMVVSDHSPSPPAEKRLDSGDFCAAWGGISSVQFSLSSVWTAAEERGFTLADVATWMSSRPARLAGLDGRKGAIEPGLDADLVVFADTETFTVGAQDVLHRHALSPHVGRKLRGRVRHVLLRGEPVFHDGTVAGEPRGALAATIIRGEG